jgi:hypothetical protein
MGGGFSRFRLVYAQRETAFKADNIDAMLRDEAAAKSTIAKIGTQSESFGALKGKTGISRRPRRQQDHE